MSPRRCNRPAGIASISMSAAATTRSSTTCRASSARSTTRRSFITCRTPCRRCASCKIPKTLLELEGNDLFNYDPNHSRSRPRREEGTAAGPAGPGTATSSRRMRTAISASSTPARTRRPARTSMPSSSRSRSPASPPPRTSTGSSTPGARAGCCKAADKVEIDSRRAVLDRAPARPLRGDRARRRTEEVQAGRHRRAGLRRRRTERARRQPADGRQQFLARAAFRQTAGASRLGLRAVDQRARPQMRVRSRQFAGLGAQTYEPSVRPRSRASRRCCFRS